MRFIVKKTVLFALLFSALNSFGFATYSPERPDMLLVLGLNKQAPALSNPFQFPCTHVADRVYCGNSGIRFENEQCAKSIFVDRIADKMEISCNIGLRSIVLGVTMTHARVKLPHSKSDFYPVRFSKNVRIKTSNTRGYIYDIVVDKNGR